MAKPVSMVELASEELQLLERRVQAPTASQRERLRACIVLWRSDGCSLRQAAWQFGVSAPCVRKWSQHLDQQGLTGLLARPGRGVKRSILGATVRKIIEMAGVRSPGKFNVRGAELSGKAGRGVGLDKQAAGLGFCPLGRLMAAGQQPLSASLRLPNLVRTEH